MFKETDNNHSKSSHNGMYEFDEQINFGVVTTVTKDLLDLRRKSVPTRSEYFKALDRRRKEKWLRFDGGSAVWWSEWVSHGVGECRWWSPVNVLGGSSGRIDGERGLCFVFRKWWHWIHDRGVKMTELA